ncbi:MAG: hypothetical protein ACI9XP_001152 [Lentimonas sp.]|jgi:hypothetical protein
MNAVQNTPMADVEFEIRFEISGSKSEVIATGKSTIDGIINVNIDAVKHKTYRYKLILISFDKDIQSLAYDVSDFGDEDSSFEKRIVKGELNDFTFKIVKRVNAFITILNENCQSSDVLKLESVNLNLGKAFGTAYHDFFFDSEFTNMQGCVDEEIKPVNSNYTYAGTNLIRKTVTENGTTTVSVDTVYLGYTNAEVDSINIVY